MSSSLLKRIISALVLAPCFLFAIIYGGVPLSIWLFVAFVISVYEWFQLSRKVDYFAPALILGIVYMSLSYASFLALREIYSAYIIALLLGMIWFSDIGAYFVGKTVGGPKLIQTVSPNKTWSGFGGALFFPALFAVIWVAFIGIDPQVNHPSIYIMMPVAALMGVVIGSVGQAGDLLVSFVKRQAQVKDTGNIIPGHGGLLDRIDSMLLATPVFLTVITLLSYVL